MCTTRVQELVTGTIDLLQNTAYNKCQKNTTIDGVIVNEAFVYVYNLYDIKDTFSRP